MRTPVLAAAAAALGGAALAAAFTYDVQILERYDEPAMSIKKPTGQGYSPCTYTFNPAWLEPVPGNPGLNRSILIFRAAGCPPSYGGSGDHLLFAYCNADGTCGDAQSLQFPFESEAEDPRVVYWDGWWWLYYFASGSGQATVYLRKSQTPLDPTSWVPVLPKPLAWHRNGCVLLRPNGTHYVIFGESGGPKVGPLPGIGIASTTDFVNYEIINTTWMEPYGANGTASEIVLEAATPPVQLSTGDYFHIYAAGTVGWVPKGSYEGGFVILDKDDPTHIIQRSGGPHPFVPVKDYEIGNGIWPVQRNRTLFLTSVVPIAGKTDTFRVWYGAADANIASMVIQVTHA